MVSIPTTVAMYVQPCVWANAVAVTHAVNLFIVCTQLCILKFGYYSFVYSTKTCRQHVMQNMNSIMTVLCQLVLREVNMMECRLKDNIVMSLTYFSWVWYDDDRLIPLLCRPCIMHTPCKIGNYLDLPDLV